MAMFHDVYTEGASQNVAVPAAGAVSAATTAFGTQTRWIRLAFIGAVSATTGCRYQVGDGTINGTNLATLGTLLPVNWVQYVACLPGQKVAAVSNDATAVSLNVTELTS